jgi:hypothetical protein
MADDRELVIRALRRLAEAARKGQDPDAHPTVEEIIAYHSGELAEEQDLALRQHLLLCRDCPDLILALDGFAKLPDGESEPAPAGMDSAWEVVRQQLAREGWFRGGTGQVSRPRRPFLMPRNLLAAAAIVLVASLGFFLLRNERQLRQVEQPSPGLPQWEVPPPTRGQGVEPIDHGPFPRGFTLVVNPVGTWSSAEYRVELLKPGGGKLWDDSWRPKSPSASFYLEAPPGSLAPGEYRFRFTGRTAAEAVDERRFQLELSVPAPSRIQ